MRIAYEIGRNYFMYQKVFDELSIKFDYLADKRWECGADEGENPYDIPIASRTSRGNSPFKIQGCGLSGSNIFPRLRHRMIKTVYLISNFTLACF